jgi:hypothetical protein
VKPEGKRQLGRPKRRLEDNIKKGLFRNRMGSVDLTDLAQVRDRWRGCYEGGNASSGYLFGQLRNC